MQFERTDRFSHTRNLPLKGNPVQGQINSTPQRKWAETGGQKACDALTSTVMSDGALVWGSLTPH